MVQIFFCKTTLSCYFARIGVVCLIIGLYRISFQAFVQALMNPDTTSYGYDLAQKTVQDQVRDVNIAVLYVAASCVILPGEEKGKWIRAESKTG